MKKDRLMIIASFLLVASLGVPVYAAKVVDVSASVHNFSMSAAAVSLPHASNNETQVCIFCHTPHNADVANERPLWNRQDPTTMWVFYNSATLEAASRPNAVSTVKPASLMCLSCHDGSIGVNRVINESNTTVSTAAGGTLGDIEIGNSIDPVPAQAIMQGDGFFFPTIPGLRIGAATDSVDVFNDTGKLYDDHPISFSYSAAQGDDLQLHPIGDAKLAGLVFYPRNGTADHLECGTCHDPHVAYDPDGDPLSTLKTLANPAANPNYAPFLRISNTGSAMCLTCHNK